MLVLGLTGKACAGKNQYARVFESFGCKTVDVDRLGHEALQANTQELVRVFGPSVVNAEGVDRKALGSLVFSDPQKLRQLEAITHPSMVEACKALIGEAKKQGAAAIVLNAALLERMGLALLCDHVLFIRSPFLIRFLRCRKREGLTIRKFYKREQMQKDIKPSSLQKQTKVTIFTNTRSLSVIHRQIATYCGTIGIDVTATQQNEG